MGDQLAAGSYVIVPSTFKPGVHGEFGIWMITNQDVGLQQIQGTPLGFNRIELDLSPRKKPSVDSFLKSDIDRLKGMLK